MIAIRKQTERKRSMNKEERHRVYILMIGILIFFIVVSVQVLVFTCNKFKCELGLALGSLLAIAMSWHMNYVIIKSMYIEKHHSAYFAFNSVGRMLVVAGVIFLIMWLDVADAIFTVVGMLSLKFAAYVHPFLDKKIK